MSKKWRKRIRRVNHIAAKVGAVAVNVVPGVGQALSAAALAAIAIQKKMADERHAKNARDRENAAITAQNAEIEKQNAAALMTADAPVQAGTPTVSDAGASLTSAGPRETQVATSPLINKASAVPSGGAGLFIGLAVLGLLAASLRK